MITTCKGRLAHLQESLPRMLAQPDCECIVVDYDCPQGAASWVACNHPGARIVKAEREPLFRPGHARNLGAAAAVAPWLAFVDADTLLAPDYVATIFDRIAAGRYYRPAPLQRDLWGNVVCERDAFGRVGGYDDVMIGWGAEDDDLYLRLGFAGCRAAEFPASLLATIPHDDTQRVRFMDVADRWLNQRAHALYCRIKYDLMRQSGQAVLPPDVRRALYAEVRRTVVEDATHNKQSSQFTVHLPVETGVPILGWTIRRKWLYTLDALENGPAS